MYLSNASKIINVDRLLPGQSLARDNWESNLTILWPVWREYLLLPNHCMIEAVDNRHYRTLRTCKAQLGMVTTETNIFHNPTFVFKINV